MITLWFINLLLAHAHPPVAPCLAIQKWEDHNQFITILILFFTL